MTSFVSLSDEKQSNCVNSHIFVLGRCGVGKSTLFNTLVGQEVFSASEEIVNKTVDIASYTCQYPKKSIYEDLALANPLYTEEERDKRLSTKVREVLEDKKNEKIDAFIMITRVPLLEYAIGDITRLQKEFGEEILKSFLLVIVADKDFYRLRRPAFIEKMEPLVNFTKKGGKRDNNDNLYWI